jgi:hypothetical protein
MITRDMLTFIVALAIVFGFFTTLSVGGYASVFPTCAQSQQHHFVFVTLCDSGDRIN